MVPLVLTHSHLQLTERSDVDVLSGLVTLYTQGSIRVQTVELLTLFGTASCYLCVTVFLVFCYVFSLLLVYVLLFIYLCPFFFLPSSSSLSIDGFIYLCCSLFLSVCVFILSSLSVPLFTCLCSWFSLSSTVSLAFLLCIYSFPYLCIVYLCL